MKSLFHLSILLLFLITLCLSCFAEKTKNVPQDVVTKLSSTASSRDYLLGWFKIAGSERIITIFKVDSTYYSVCRGFEIPLKECTEGLEWNVTPSSMTGTKIGYDKASATYYIAVMDNQASNFTDGKYGIGEKEIMIKIDKPAELLEPTTLRPLTNDNFVGVLQSSWFPMIRFIVQKEGEKYYYTWQSYKEDAWKNDDFTKELKPLPDRLGFTGFEDNHNLIYNSTLHRYEIINVDKKRQPETIRMPMIRNPQFSSPKSVFINSPKLKIGIPSWD